MRFCWVLAVLVFAATFSFAQIRPEEKLPTEITLHVEKNGASGVLDARATLIALDLSGNAAVPLQGEIVFFQECAVGEFASGCPSGAHRCGPIPQDYWQCSSDCCMGHMAKLTDLEGKADATFEGANRTSIFAVYPGSNAYLPSNTTANYVYPTVNSSINANVFFPLMVLIACFVLIVFSALFFRNRFR